MSLRVQHYALFKHMTVFDNVAFGLRVRPRRSVRLIPEIDDRVMALLKLVHLDKFYDRFPSQLFAAASASASHWRARWAVEPRLLLLDEPSARSTPRCGRNCAAGCAACMTTSISPASSSRTTRKRRWKSPTASLVMNNGKIEQMGTPEQVYHQPANGFVYDFLGNYNEFVGWKDENGDVHLAEDDLWESHKPAVAPVATASGRPHWLARYPELVRCHPQGRPRPAASHGHAGQRASYKMTRSRCGAARRTRYPRACSQGRTRCS